MKNEFEELDWDKAKKSGKPNQYAQYRAELEEASAIKEEHECTTGKFLLSLHDTVKKDLQETTAHIKDTNPKDAVGTKKATASTIPSPVMMEVGVAMLEGARKYGRSNYRRAGIRESVYYDAAMRHLAAYWEGEDLDPDSGLSHITKAIASLVVLRDGQMNETSTDDRPPKFKAGWMQELNKKAAAIIEKYPNAPKAFTEKIDVV